MSHSASDPISTHTRAARTTRHIVLVGAGHAHVEVLRRFGRAQLRDIHLTLITKGSHALYSGMLPGYIAGHYGMDEIQIPIEPLARFANCKLIVAEAIRLDPTMRSVELSDGSMIFADALSVDTGAQTNLAGSLGLEAEIIPAKPIEDLAQWWKSLVGPALSAPDFGFTVVGSGAAGVELALSIRHRLRQQKAGHQGNHEAIVTLIASDEGILPGFPANVRRRFSRHLRERGVEVRSYSDFRAAFIKPSGFGGPHTLIWATGVIPINWLSTSGLAVDAGGFVAVDRYLQSTSHAGIFAAGDAAGMLSSPRPKAGVIAVRQGPVLADNLHRYIVGQPLQPFIPQRSWLSLISTGDRQAVAERNGFSVEGAWVWYWKRWIDRRFIARYTVR